MDPNERVKHKDKEFISKHSGGSYSLLNKNDVLQTMDLIYPEWREENKTFVFPIITEPTFEGPLTDDTSDYDRGLVKGYHSEVDVLWALKKVSHKNSLGLRIFHGISITKPMLEATAAAFETDLPDFKDKLVTKESREICDAILLHPAGISVIEIKSNENAVPKAKTQLNKAFDVIKVILKIVGVDAEKVPIHRVIALPNPLSEKTENKKEKLLKRIENFCLLQGTQFEKKLIEEQLLRSMDSKSYVLTPANIDDLSVVLAILKQGKLVNSRGKIPSNLFRKQMLEGVAINETIGNIRGQNQLQNSLGSKKFQFKRKHLFIWLDPRQAEILEDSNTKQYIIGPASTGKTLLVQLKVLEILELNPESKILIILPHNHLVESYKKSFQDFGLEIQDSNLLITTLSGHWRTFGDAHHTFIDEYCAIGPKESVFSKNHQDLKCKVENMPQTLYCWITMDFWQGYETVSHTKHYITLKDSKLTALTMFHRCTIGVLKEYRKNYSEVIMQVGHQYAGQSCETVCNSSGANSMNDWAKTIQETVVKQKKMGWEIDQIGIILVRPNIVDADICIYKLQKRLEEEGLNPKFDFETLSTEWPVVLICLPNGKSEDLSIAQSRAIAKIIYIQAPNDIIDNDPRPFIINNRVSHLSLFVAFLKTRMEIFAYHQELHRNKKLLEVTTFMAFVDDIKLKIDQAKDNYVTLTGEVLRQIYNLYLGNQSAIVSSYSNILYSVLTEILLGN